MDASQEGVEHGNTVAEIDDDVLLVRLKNATRPNSKHQPNDMSLLFETCSHLNKQIGFVIAGVTLSSHLGIADSNHYLTDTIENILPHTAALHQRLSVPDSPSNDEISYSGETSFTWRGIVLQFCEKLIEIISNGKPVPDTFDYDSEFVASQLTLEADRSIGPQPSEQDGSASTKRVTRLRSKKTELRNRAIKYLLEHDDFSPSEMSVLFDLPESTIFEVIDSGLKQTVRQMNQSSCA